MNFELLQENGHQTIIGDGKHLTPYMENLIKENRISRSKATSIRDRLQNSYNKGGINDKQLILRVHRYNGDLDYNQLFKNVINHEERCPICLNDMIYEKCICNSCGFDFKLAKYTEDDFSNMLKIHDFVDSHASLKKEVKELSHKKWYPEDFIHKLYGKIYLDKDLRKEYKSLNLDQICDLDEVIGFENGEEKFEYNQLLKNMLIGNEICPECYAEMNYEKCVCNNCGFDFRQVCFKGEEFKDMRKIYDFVQKHESLRKKIEEMRKDNIHCDNFTFDLYTCIAMEEKLLKDYNQLNLDKICDLYELFGFKEDIDNLEYDELLKNVITRKEECPIFHNKMDYEKGICDCCGFDFKQSKFTSKDFRNMRKIRDFVEKHGSLTETVEEMQKGNVHHATFMEISTMKFIPMNI